MLGLVMMVAAIVQPSGYTQCIAKVDHAGFVKSQMLECATTEMDRADGALNEAYKAVISRLAPQQRSRLVIEERAWIAARRRKCLAAEHEQIPSPEINRMLCLVRESDARTATLRALS